MSRLLWPSVAGTVFLGCAWWAHSLSAEVAAPPSPEPAAPAPALRAGVEAVPLDLEGALAETIGDSDVEPRRKPPRALDPPPVPPGKEGKAEPERVEAEEEILRIRFEELTRWDLDPEDIQVPRSIQDWSGKRMDLVGYMIPYGDPESVTEFVLVNDLGSCCFGIQPKPNHILTCEMAEGKSTIYFPGSVRVRGRFRVEVQRHGGYLVSVYAMVVEDCAEVR